MTALLSAACCVRTDAHVTQLLPVRMVDVNCQSIAIEEISPLQFLGDGQHRTGPVQPLRDPLSPPAGPAYRAPQTRPVRPPPIATSTVAPQLPQHPEFPRHAARAPSNAASRIRPPEHRRATERPLCRPLPSQCRFRRAMATTAALTNGAAIFFTAPASTPTAPFGAVFASDEHFRLKATKTRPRDAYAENQARWRQMAKGHRLPGGLDGNQPCEPN